MMLFSNWTLCLSFNIPSVWYICCNWKQKKNILLPSPIPSTDVIQLTLTLKTLKRTTAQVVKTSCSRCQQQSYSGLHSPGQSYSIYLPVFSLYIMLWAKIKFSLIFSKILYFLCFLTVIIKVKRQRKLRINLG